MSYFKCNLSPFKEIFGSVHSGGWQNSMLCTASPEWWPLARLVRGMSSEMLEIHFVLHLILIGISVTNDRINNIWKLCQISQIILLEELIPNTSFLSEITNKIGGSIIKQKENLGKNDQSEKQGASGPSKTSSWGLFWGSNQTWTQGWPSHGVIFHCKTYQWL